MQRGFTFKETINPHVEEAETARQLRDKKNVRKV